MRELNGSFDMPDEAGEEYRRRIRADYTALHTERTSIKTQLSELAADEPPGPCPRPGQPAARGDRRPRQPAP